MKVLLKQIVKELVDNPREVEVKETSASTHHVFVIHVLQDDRGKVIGKNGSIILALRTLMNSFGMKYGQKNFVHLEGNTNSKKEKQKSWIKKSQDFLGIN